MRRFLVFGGVVVIAVVAFYAYYLTQRTRCVGSGQDEIEKIARQKLPIEIERYFVATPRPSLGQLRSAKIVQFVDWHNSRAGYTVVFQVGAEKEYWFIAISGAYSARVGRTSNLFSPI